VGVFLRFSAVKVGHTDIVFGVSSGLISIVLFLQDYKSLCAAITICATLVNIQTQGHSVSQQLISLYMKCSQCLTQLS